LTKDFQRLKKENDEIDFKLYFQACVAPLQQGRLRVGHLPQRVRPHGRAVQVDSIKTRVESAYYWFSTGFDRIESAYCGFNTGAMARTKAWCLLIHAEAFLSY
jgi:hypothetical protein